MTTGVGLVASAQFIQASNARRLYPAYRSETSGGWQKYAGNPVLGRDLGTCFDVCVLHDADRFRLWFSWRPLSSIGYSESLDGVSWSKPVIALAPDSQSAWQTTVNRPSVVRVGNTYHLWYTGQSSDHSAIGYARSQDGVSWERVGSEPVFLPQRRWENVAVMTPSVLWDVGRRRFRLWYAGGDQFEPNAIGYAESTDGIRWTRIGDGPVFGPSGGNAWDRARVTGPQVIRWRGWHLMFYIGFYNTWSAEIGLARSRNGVDNWERFPGNPIIRPAQDAGRWDYDAVYRPWALPSANGWMLWYNGRRGDTEQIGLARHPGLALWT